MNFVKIWNKLVSKEEDLSLLELLKDFKSKVDKDVYEKSCGKYILNGEETDFTNYLREKDVHLKFADDFEVIDDVTRGIRRDIVLEYAVYDEYLELYIICMKGCPRLKKVKFDSHNIKGEF